MSRYERVKEILATAAGGSVADYGGLGPFWELPLDRLLTASVGNVRLMAPEEAAGAPSCCARRAAASRSARSGLVAGLRGAAPFDGTRFPRLPWGGSAVAESDVQLIADWIDDGCPVEGSGAEIGAIEASGPVTIEREGYSVYEGVPNEYKYQHGELRQRVNLDCMTPSQLENL